jgi:FKBP-type peptidyl-prolyl cis-trans isomerase
MKLKPVLVAASLLLSIALPLVAQAQTVTKPRAAVTHRRKRSVKRKLMTPPAPVQLAETLPSGLTYAITHHGEGQQQAKAGDIVAVHYTGLLTNGITFDSSRTSGQPIKFKLGAAKVIKGWDEGIAKLRVGDHATFVIPPQLAYGERGRGPIPPNATLVFIVELVSIEEAPNQ